MNAPRHAAERRPVTDPKELLHERLQMERETLWDKASGLPEWQARWPVTPTGTNLLGLVKHMALVEAGYFGSVFGSPLPDPPAFFEDDTLADDDDLWAFADESPEEIFALARRVAKHSDEVIASHALSDLGHVPWWGNGGRDASLAELMVHTLDEIARHVGHADIVREFLDGSAGHRAHNSNLPEGRTAEQWAARKAHLEAVATASRGTQAGNSVVGH